MAYTIHESYIGMENYYWFNVSKPVGPYGPNFYDDVCLVQILLAYLRPYVKVLGQPALPAMKIDGIYGPVTAAYIEAYQSYLHPKLIDGIVEPGRRWQKESALWGAGATIVSLNFELWQLARAAHEGIRTNLHTPAALRVSLSRIV